MIRAGLLGLLLILVVFIPHSRSVSHSLPPGGWGRTIACLERYPIYELRATRGGGLPDATTRSVELRSSVHHDELAVLRDTGSPAAARAVARHNGLHLLSGTQYRTAGSIVWSYVENGDPPKVSANAGDTTIVGFCVRTPDRRRG